MVPLCDPPHLLKGGRNNLINSEASFSWKKEKQTASCKHIVQLYDMDVKDELVIGCKLTNKQIYKDKIIKMHTDVTFSFCWNKGESKVAYVFLLSMLNGSHSFEK